MRIFNFRYLLIAAAMLSVWLLGRSRTVQPALDASWTSVTVSNVDDSMSTEVAGLTTDCKQNGVCTDDLKVVVDGADQALHASMISEQAMSMGESNVFEEVEPMLVGESEVIEEASDVDMSLVDSNSEIEPALEPFVSEAEESISTLAMDSTDSVKPLLDFNSAGYEEGSFEPATQMPQAEIKSEMQLESNLANVGPRDASGAESTSQANRIGNRFVAEVEQQAGRSSGSWTKNPFAGDDFDFSSNTQGAGSEQPTRTSFEEHSDSILESKPTTQVSHPERDLSQINFVHNDVAPSNVKLSESVAQEAVHHIEYGKSLSRRGASFGARQKFFAALGVIARGNDVQSGGNGYTVALGRANRALREAQDFAVRNAEIHVAINVAEILETHQTRVISAHEAEIMTPVEAMQRYFTFAHQQLSFAVGRNAVAAETLYCLGKLHTVLAKHHPETLDIAKAIVFHRAAISSDARNARSYNELGTLLAHSGQLSEAEDMFKKSLQIQPVAETWQNLAKTHSRQGEEQLAQLARTEFAIAAQSTPVPSPSNQIAWLPGQAFNQVGPADFQDSRSTISGAVVPAGRDVPVAGDEDKDGSAKKTFAERFNSLKNWF